MALGVKHARAHGMRLTVKKKAYFDRLFLFPVVHSQAGVVMGYRRVN